MKYVYSQRRLHLFLTARVTASLNTLQQLEMLCKLLQSLCNKLYNQDKNTYSISFFVFILLRDTYLQKMCMIIQWLVLKKL